MLREDKSAEPGEAAKFVVVEGDYAPSVVADSAEVDTDTTSLSVENATVAADTPPVAEAPAAGNIFVRVWNRLFGSNDAASVDANVDDSDVTATEPTTSGWGMKCCGSAISSVANPNDADARAASEVEVITDITGHSNVTDYIDVTITDRTDEHTAIISEAINKDMADATISTFVFAPDNTSLSVDLALSSSDYSKLTALHTPTIVGQIGAETATSEAADRTIAALLLAGDHNVEVTPIDMTVTDDSLAADVAMIGESA